MNTRERYAVIFALALLGGVVLVAVTWAAPGIAPLAGGAPEVVAYQGEVRVGGAPYAGDGYFKFAIVNAAGDTSYWSNDGTSTAGGEPTAAVQLAVSDGLFSVLLGDTSLGGMTQALTHEVFGGPDRYLRVWFSSIPGGPFDRLAPDTRIAAVPYALQAQEAVNADTVDGLHAEELGTHYQNVLVVAKSGGDYASVQAAIDSIDDAAPDNAYLVWAAPGVYEEQVTLKPYVHLQGAGQDVTVITSDVSTGVWPPDQGTLALASNASLRDLTVENTGLGDVNAALLATPGVEGTVVADVTARALGSGVANTGIAVVGSPTRVTLQQVTALAENASDHNSGLTALTGVDAVLRGGTFTGRGGERARGALVMQSGTRLEAVGVSMLAENASEHNTAMYPYDGAEVVLRGGDFTARGGDQTNGVACAHNSALAAYDITVLAEDGVTNYGMGPFDGSSMTVRGATVIARGGSNNYALDSESTVTLDAESVIALAENGSNENYGLWNANNSQATVRGGAFTGRGGTNAGGIYNHDSGTTLDAESVTALAEDASGFNCGLRNEGGAVAMLHGGSLTGREDGGDVYGIYNAGAGSLVVADSVSVLGEGIGNMKYGLWNSEEARAELHGGSCIARGETGAVGVVNLGGNTTLECESVMVLAEGGDVGPSVGLENGSGAVATLRGGSFTALRGTDARGIWNAGSDATLECESVTALGKDGSGTNHGLYNSNSATTDVTQGVLEGVTHSVYHDDSGSVTVSNSRLAGNAVSGTVTCVAVSRGGTFNTNGCP
jgi:hypothetical protein